MHSVAMDNHIGTHIEVPFHCLPDGAGLGQIEVERFAGDAIILDVRGHSAGEAVPVEVVQRAASVAGGIGAGDIVFCMTGWSVHHGTEVYMQSPYLSPQAVCWLVGYQLKILGIDTPGAMDPAVPD